MVVISRVKIEKRWYKLKVWEFSKKPALESLLLSQKKTKDGKIIRDYVIFTTLKGW